MPPTTEHPAARRALLVFVDGVGIGPRDPARNPIFHEPPAFLSELLDGRLPSLRARDVSASAALCLPLDACMGVPGLPQSGTGQTALYAGVNAARIVGHHFGPYVYSTLKPVLAAHSVFARLLEAGLPRTSLALANAFPRRFFEYLAGPRRRLVAGMHAAIESGIPFRDITALQRGEAVSADITGARWKDIGHPEAPVRGAREAGRILGRTTMRHRFTLFEYFLTDKAGHERSMKLATAALRDLDALLRGVAETIDPSTTLVAVCSDHGNMEDLSVKTHTRHPVPLLYFGCTSHAPTELRSLVDVTPALCTFLRGDHS